MGVNLRANRLVAQAGSQQQKARPVIEMRRLALFKRIQDLSRYFCRLRVSATVALKLGNNLTLMQKMSLAFPNMALNLGELIDW